MKKHQYNSVPGIRSLVHSLEGLNEFKKARLEAGEERGESLDEFILFGCWWAKSNGRILEFVDYDAKMLVPWKVIPNMPQVITVHEFWDLLGKQKQPITEDRLELMGESIPYTNSSCAHCFAELTVQTAMTDVKDKGSIVIPAYPGYKGKSLGEIHKIFLKRTDAFYSIHQSMVLRNMTASGVTGWRGFSDGVSVSLFPSEGYELLIMRTRFFHEACAKLLDIN